MSIRRWFAALLATVLTTAGALHLRAESTFRGLATVGGDYSEAWALSADGSVVVGWSRNPDGDGRPFRWQDGTMAAIGEPTHWAATAVSADGSVVILQGDRGPFRWEDGAVVPLPPSGVDAYGYDISADGSVVVGTIMFTIFDPPRLKSYANATVWGPPDETGDYGRRTLRGLTGGFQSFANGVSGDGSVIVGMSEDWSGKVQAVRWQGSRAIRVGSLGGPRSGAHDVSADGSVIVGWAERADGTEEAFRWEDGTMLGLGILPGDWEETAASAVSADGSLVVGSGWKSQPVGPSISEPFIWDQAHGMRSLTQLLTNNGVDLADWDLNSGVDVSADGRVIVGNGYHISADRQEGWIATIPEPSTLAGLLTITATALVLHLRRHRKRHAC